MDIKKGMTIEITKEYCNPDNGFVRWQMGDPTMAQIYSREYIVDSVNDNNVVLRDCRTNKTITRARSFFQSYCRGRKYYVGDLWTLVNTYIRAVC